MNKKIYLIPDRTIASLRMNSIRLYLLKIRCLYTKQLKYVGDIHYNYIQKEYVVKINKPIDEEYAVDTMEKVIMVLDFIKQRIPFYIYLFN